jgi:predicted porin
MNKKVMALAVAGALAAPAAALAQVQIGGSIHLQYFNHDPDNKSSSSTTDVLTTSEPEIYIRGEEKLGGGNSMWMMCTSSFDVLGQGLGSWCGRNSAIGFQGGWGNVFAGTWDTPHKLVTNLARGWWGGTNTLQGGTMVVIGNGADSNVGNTGASFFRRHRRSINYHSANWSGFSLQAAVSAGNESTAIADSSPLSPRMYSIAGQFRTGPFFAALAYENHNDFNPAQALGGTTTLGGYTGGSDTSINVVVGYTFFNALRASALYMKNEYDAGGAGGLTGKLKQDGYALYVDWTLSGPHSLYFQYGNRPESDFAGVKLTDSGAQVMGAAYGYRLSKRSQIYFAVQQLKNDDNQSLNFGTASTTAGGKQQVVGFGLRHSF